jgi:hydrogenase maturation protease
VSARILVAGIGNVFLGDDGFGVEVARRLARGGVPAEVAVSEVGIRSLHLAYALLDRPELLIVVDAVRRGEPPGTLYLIQPDELAAARAEAEVPDAHGMSLPAALAMLRTLGGQPPPILLVGCEPEFVGERLGLGPIVESALPAAEGMVRAAIARQLGIAAPLAAHGRAR